MRHGLIRFFEGVGKFAVPRQGAVSRLRRRVARVVRGTPRHSLGVFDVHGHFSREDESKSIPRLGGHIGLVVPTRDIVLQFALLRDQCRFLTFETIEFGKAQGVGVKGRDELDRAQRHDEQGDEKRHWPATGPLAFR